MGKKVRLLQKITTQGTLKCESKRGLAVRDGGIWMERVLALVEQEIENPGKPVVSRGELYAFLSAWRTGERDVRL